MTADTKTERQEKLFDGAVVYFSGSIHGVLNGDPEFSYKLVKFMQDNGALVLDTHVAGRTDDERRRMFIEDNGYDPLEGEEPWLRVERTDIDQVDRATHIVAIVDGPSHGVGNEIQRGVDNYEFGRKRTEILCLVREGNLDKLSWMIRGKVNPRYPNFHLATYKEFEDAVVTLTAFLTQPIDRTGTVGYNTPTNE